MKAMSLSKLYSRTGCFPKCAQTKYKFNLKKLTPIKWRSSSISSFYLTAESDQVEEQVEYLVYDMQVCSCRYVDVQVCTITCADMHNLIIQSTECLLEGRQIVQRRTLYLLLLLQNLWGDVGGYLGLLLGWFSHHHHHNYQFYY